MASPTPVHLLPTLAFLFATAVPAQGILPPFHTTYQALNLGSIAGLTSYGGTAFQRNDPNVLLVSPWPGTTVVAVPLIRDLQGYIVGTGQGTPLITVGGTDGGLAFGPGDVLFATWFGPNRLSQIRPGSTTADRVDDLDPLGIASSVGACTFVPAGLPGAGRLKVASYSTSLCYDVPLTADGNGTFAPGNVATTVQLQGGVEGLVYAPAGMAMLGGQLLVAEWAVGNIVAYQVDAIGDPLPATRQVVVGGLNLPGGGAVDPVTGDIVFTNSPGELVILRNGTACGTFAGYGAPSPGALGTPTIAAAGCARIGQTLTLATTGPVDAIGVIALGFAPTDQLWLGLRILQWMDVTVLDTLDSTGVGSRPLEIPFLPILGNSHYYLQCAYIDGSTPAGLIASAGLDILIR